MSEDVKMTLGLLFDFMPPIGESLLNDECQMVSEYDAKWKQQVIAIVKDLHSHDILWGNIHPGHVVEVKDSDALVC